ncbi:DNA ligase 6 isoform X1 [Quercus suber]|uniref:DNA ligase 6 isoform X1 n=1 Tax=Quercus suber TaxID=58331 RepID=UPI0032DFFB68
MASSSKTLTLDSSQLFLAALQSQSLPPPSPLSPIPSSFPPSKLIPNTRFLVDAFRGDSSFSVSYFLSHFHSDHYAGLSATWSKGIIFSSPTTALLLNRVLKLPSPFVVPLPLRQTVVIDGCQITLIDANHCPGAVQFFFNIPGPNGGRYVHTGDFRFSDSMRFDSFLTQFIGSDAVFLDTTYCNPKFVFPSQDESIDYVVSVIDRVRVGGDSLRDVLFLVATYVVGKERILLEIARRCNRKIHVDARKMEVLRVLGYGESGLFTEDVCESDVHVVGWNVLGETWPYFRPNFVKMKEIMDERGYSKVVGFVPTGWTYEVKRNKFAVRTKDSFEIHLVPYSEHSNYDELREYVKLLKPKRVIPTVGLDVENLDSKHADKMQKHFAGLVDEMANKQEFLRGFYRGSCEVVDKVERDASTNEELDKENEIKETKAKGSDINDPGFALDNSSSPKEPGTQDPVVLNDEDISSLQQSSSQDPVMLNDEDMEKLVQELCDCLPTWVTHNQILDLISTSGRNIVEAVSNFYERETEFHEQVLASTATTSVSTSQSSSLNVSASLSKAGFVMSSPIGSIDNALSKVYKSANLKHSRPGKGKGTIDKKPNKKVKVNSIKSGTSPGKRKMNVENKTNKKVNSKLESGGSKQSTITSFFSKVLPDVSEGGKVGTLFEQSPIDENLLPDDSAKFYRDEIDQFIQIINGNESSRSCAATILEKTKGDINKALDIYFCNHEGDLGDSNKSVLVQSSVNNCSPGQKKNVLGKEHVPDISLQSTLTKDVDATPVSLPPEQYNPIEHACWRSGQPAPYIHLARTFDQLEDEKGKIKATSMLCNMFRSLLALSPEDVLPAAYLCTNKIAADHENIELNIGGSLVSSSLEEACGTNRTKLKEMYNKIGDLGDVAQECRQTQTLLAPPSPLLIRDVFSALRKISGQTGSGSTVRKKNVIVNLMCSCREKEMKFLVRTLVRNLRIGAMMRTVLPALAQAVVFNSSPNFYHEGKVDNLKENLQFLSAAVVEAYNILPNLDLVVPSLMNKGVKFSSSTLSMIPGIPIKPMLAKITNGVPQALKLFQNKAFSCEYKYDGQRAQVHKLVDGTVRIFSRNGDESTSRFPDVINIIKESCRPAAMTFILDAEVVAVDRKNGFKLMSFQELSSRGRGSKDNLITVDSIKVDICVFVFDIMFANGQQLLGFSLRKRRKYLKDLFHNEKLGYFEYAKEMTVEADDACLTNEVTLNKISSFLEDAFSSSCEGLVVKLLDFDAEYSPSKRTDTWLKVKRDYVEGLCDSLDLVPIGAWHGNGRKAGWYSPFLMACYNPDTEEFQSVCRVMSGFSDSFYIEMKGFFSGDKILSKKPPYYRTAEVPDKWFSPELVWQIRGADFTLSPVHQAAIGLVHPSRGISIRFPRFINPVSDRNPEESSTAADIAEMFQSQTRKMDVTSEA